MLAEQVANEKLAQLEVDLNSKWGKAMVEVAGDAFFLAVNLQQGELENQK